MLARGVVIALPERVEKCIISGIELFDSHNISAVSHSALPPQDVHRKLVGGVGDEKLPEKSELKIVRSRSKLSFLTSCYSTLT